MSYQKFDAGLIDYQDARFGIRRRKFRAPPLESVSNYVVCIGAAQTYGRYAERPYPTILGEKLGIPCFNLGTGGAGPTQFLYDPELLRAINSADVCVVQTMSARSVPNHYFSVLAGDNAHIKNISEEVYDECPGLREKDLHFTHDILHYIANHNPKFYQKVQYSCRKWWKEYYKSLLSSITTRKILLWFSEREPHDMKARYAGRKVLAKFPQLVNEDMVNEVRAFADAYVSCVSSEGLPQDLTVNSEAVVVAGSGKKRAENTYYPSPEMHRLAAEALVEPVEALRRTGRPSGVPAVGRFVPRTPRTLVHVHIPKSAGSSLNRRLFLPNFTKADVCLADTNSGTKPIPELVQFARNHRDGCLIVGHIPYGCIRPADPDAVYFSVLRAPRNRFVSFMNHALNLKDYGLWKRFGDDFRLACLQDPNVLVQRVSTTPDLRKFQSDVMTRMSAGLARRSPDEMNDDVLQKANHNIQAGDYIVGIFEHMDDFVARVRDEFQLTYFEDHYFEKCAKDDTRHLFRKQYEKRVPKKVRYDELSAASKATIDEMNIFDFKLYDDMCARHANLTAA